MSKHAAQENTVTRDRALAIVEGFLRGNLDGLSAEQVFHLLDTISAAEETPEKAHYTSTPYLPSPTYGPVFDGPPNDPVEY